MTAAYLAQTAIRGELELVWSLQPAHLRIIKNENIGQDLVYLVYVAQWSSSG